MICGISLIRRKWFYSYWIHNTHHVALFPHVCLTILLYSAMLIRCFLCKELEAKSLWNAYSCFVGIFFTLPFLVYVCIVNQKSQNVSHISNTAGLWSLNLCLSHSHFYLALSLASECRCDIASDWYYDFNIFCQYCKKVLTGRLWAGSEVKYCLYTKVKQVSANVYVLFFRHLLSL